MPIGRPLSPGSVAGVNRRTRRRTRRRTAVVAGAAGAAVGRASASSGNQSAQAPSSDEKTPKQILDERLAKGEITPDEYSKAVAALTQAG